MNRMISSELIEIGVSSGAFFLVHLDLSPCMQKRTLNLPVAHSTVTYTLWF